MPLLRALAVALSLTLSACGASAPPTATAPLASASPGCDSPEHRQFDFWLGDWDLQIRARKAPGSDEWAEARGTQRIERILNGCVIAEHFAADGPTTPWAGSSYSVWQPNTRAWRQTWVDDQGGYILLTGAVEAGIMTLLGEPRTQDGHRIQMRMVFLDVKPDSLRWEWQRQVDQTGPWTPMLVIDYRRRPRSG